MKDVIRHCDRITLRASTGHVLQIFNDVVNPTMAGERGENTSRVCLRALPSRISRSSDASALWGQNSAEWSVTLAHAPWTPEWNRTRPLLVGRATVNANLLTEEEEQEKKKSAEHENEENISETIHLMEQTLVDDLLCAFSGHEGEYVCISASSKKSSDGALFTLRVNVPIDRACRVLVEKCLPLAEHVT